MPVAFKDRDGQELDVQEVSITGGSCLLFVSILLLAIVGLGALIADLLTLIP